MNLIVSRRCAPGGRAPKLSLAETNGFRRCKDRKSRVTMGETDDVALTMPRGELKGTEGAPTLPLPLQPLQQIHNPKS